VTFLLSSALALVKGVAVLLPRSPLNAGHDFQTVCPTGVTCNQVVEDSTLTWTDFGNSQDNEGRIGWCGTDIRSGHFGGLPDVSVSQNLFTSGANWCGTVVEISRGGKTVVGVVTDACDDCDDRHINVGKDAFNKVGDLIVGEYHDVSWKAIGSIDLANPGAQIQVPTPSAARVIPVERVKPEEKAPKPEEKPEEKPVEKPVAKPKVVVHKVQPVCGKGVDCGKPVSGAMMTWFDTADSGDNGGNIGYCGELITSRFYDGIPIVAISLGRFNKGEDWCRTKLKIENEGKSLTAIVMDACAPCPADHIDLDIKAFAKIGNIDTGVYHDITFTPIGKI